MLGCIGFLFGCVLWCVFWCVGGGGVYVGQYGVVGVWWVWFRCRLVGGSLGGVIWGCMGMVGVV